MKFQPHERVFFNILPPGAIGEMGLQPTKLEEMARSAVIQKTKLPSHPNSVFFSSNNEKRMTKAQRDFLKREQSKPEHKAPKRYIEVGMNSLHRIQVAYIPISPRQPTFPRRSGFSGVRRWSPVNHASVVHWRRGAPQSPSSSSFGAPQGNNKIYKCDVVFSPGETRIKSKE